MPDDIRLAADPRHCTGADACAWPGICLPGRCIAAEAAASPNFSLFSSHERSNLATLAPHCPPGLALLRGLPGEWTEPPDRQPAAPRHLPRGARVVLRVVGGARGRGVDGALADLQLGDTHERSEL